MSLTLDLGTVPKGLRCKTHGLVPISLSDKVDIGDYELTIEDFCMLVHYVMTNTDLLGPDDPRISLVKMFRKARVVDGYNSSADRYDMNFDFLRGGRFDSERE